MKRNLLIASILVIGTSYASAQSAMDGYAMSQSDLKGTARFMSMGGAFGALGGDLSAISVNPGGIGVYRSSELGLTMDLDCQSATSVSQNYSENAKNTRFLLNSVGGVATWKLNSKMMPNINFAFTYRKAASFNKRFSGAVPSLDTSLSNYIAGISNNTGCTIGDLQTTNSYDPYNPNDGGFVAPWISILGYDSMLISPVGTDDNYSWYGQFGNGTTGSGWFQSETRGGVDEYNIAFGGNVNNVVYWGMDFGIMDTNLTQETYWGENLNNAWVENNSGQLDQTVSQWNLYNFYHLAATGFNYKLGVIVKPIQELRLGVAVHTPTWYSVNETIYGEVNYRFADNGNYDYKATNNGLDAYRNYNYRTPWHFIFSAAGVIGNKLIVSADYEFIPYSHMSFSQPNYYGWGFGSSNPYQEVNGDIKDYYRTQNQIRLGAEFRLLPQLSLRAGYSFVSSPVKPAAANDKLTIWMADDTRPQYVFDNTTNYVTCGLGYRYKAFYVDLAYVYKHQNATYHPFSPDPTDPSYSYPRADIKTNHSQVVLSMGFKFL